MDRMTARTSRETKMAIIKSKAEKSTANTSKRPVPTVWGYDGYVISRDSKQVTIPMKRPKSPGYSVRRGYTYTIQRPDGTRIQRKAYSREEAEQLVDADRAKRK